MDYRTAELMTPKPTEDTLKLKIVGEDGTESKWVNITNDERRQIAALLASSRADDGIKSGVIREDELEPIAFIEYGDVEVDVYRSESGDIHVSIEPLTDEREVSVKVLTENTDEVTTLRFNEK